MHVRDLDKEVQSVKNMESLEEGLVVRGRVEIDMRKPFRSVKEAVELFGEKVLVGEIYGNKLPEMQSKAREGGGQHRSTFGAVTAELEETKKSLQKAKEEGNFMAYCLQSLKEDLEQTKRELQKFKARESHKNPVDPEIEELKFIENASKVEVNTQKEDRDKLEYFQKKRSVKFASPPSLAQVIAIRDVEVIETPPSLKKKMKKKPLLIPLIAGIFSKKKGGQEG